MKPFRMSLALAVLLALSPLAAQAAGQPSVSRAVDGLVAQALELQQADGSWEGGLEADPAVDVLYLAMGRRLGRLESDVEQGLLTRLFKWRGQSVAWGARPGAQPSLDTTGIILLCLQSLGYDERNPAIAPAWDWFRTSGGTARLNLASLMLLEAVGLATVPPNARVPVNFFGVPRLVPYNVFTQGVSRSMSIPLAILEYYRAARTARPLDPLRRASRGGEFGNPLPRHHGLPVGDFWAQEGLGWLLAHQQANGPWYTIQFTLVSIAALSEAQRLGVADFSEEIARAWSGLKPWLRRDPKGQLYVSPSDSIGWDTPRMMVALARARDAGRPIDDTALARAAAWLERTQIREKGDWAYLNPKLVPGAWSFVPENPFLPDTDVTATSIEALLDWNASSPAAARGVDWLLGMQNDDGGWAAWEKGDSHLMPLVMHLLSRNAPQFYDLGQTDVTSRILRVLTRLEDSGFDTEGRVERGCAYLRAHDSHALSGPRVWSGDWLIDYQYGTAESIDGLLTTGCADEGELEESLDWLAARQNDDGGWGESEESYTAGHAVAAPSTVMQTAFVINPFLSLEERRAARGLPPSRFAPTVARAADYLADRALKGSLDESSFTGVMLKGQWYVDYAGAPRYETLKALARALRLQRAAR